MVPVFYVVIQGGAERWRARRLQKNNSAPQIPNAGDQP
jgi:hypothetical protein